MMKFVLNNRFIIGDSGSSCSFSYVELTLFLRSYRRIFAYHESKLRKGEDLVRALVEPFSKEQEVLFDAFRYGLDRLPLDALAFLQKIPETAVRRAMQLLSPFEKDGLP
jgi:hypothetical protein